MAFFREELPMTQGGLGEGLLALGVEAEWPAESTIYVDDISIFY
jgi:hypothetical protein